MRLGAKFLQNRFQHARRPQGSCWCYLKSAPIQYIRQWPRNLTQAALIGSSIASPGAPRQTGQTPNTVTLGPSRR